MKEEGGEEVEGVVADEAEPDVEEGLEAADKRDDEEGMI
ncbi:unnamed protein product [Protopolystoma xenopodis]|uniref:Uncharacterized protein n=1 Tax=Protopolystoma xenopodis TaxID=117903 RepID=A0A3S5CN79_9PLAT|nr:unnamed protein product [Protopolystoma xenopodis]